MGYLCLMAITAAFIAVICGPAMGVAVFVAGAFITFRWFSRGDGRPQAARLKRGARFACVFLTIPVVITGMAFAFPPTVLVRPETVADVAMVLVALAPLAFGIGVVASK
jgi:hypothetical protein